MTITCPAEIGNIERITESINEQLEAAGCSIKAKMQIDVAIDELASNVAYYAYTPNTGNITVDYEFLSDTGTAKLSFIDEGKPYNPLIKEDPDVTAELEDRRIGGLGIFMVKKTMDNMEYIYENGRNIVTIFKKITE